MMKSILLSFFIAQAVFTILDLWALYRQRKLKETLQLKEIFTPAIFVFAVWLIYFIIQNTCVYFLPGFNELRLNLYHWANIELEGPQVWDWRVSLMFFWSFQVIAFFDFATHRWILHHRRFWLFHEYHHLPKMVFNGMPGISVRPFVFLISILTYVCSIFFLVWPLRTLLDPPETRAFIETGVPILTFWMTLILSIVHSHFLRQYSSLHRVFRFLLIASPHEHLLHHSSRLRCNFGNYTTIWDRVFGSYVDPMEIPYQTEPLGLNYDQDFLGTLCAGRWKLSKKIRRHFALKEIVCIED